MNIEKISFNSFFRYLLAVSFIGATLSFVSLYAQSSNVTVGEKNAPPQNEQKNDDDSPCICIDIKKWNGSDMKREGEPFEVAEEMPQFPGGFSALMNYIGQNLEHPEDAVRHHVQGKVVIRFVVTKDGDITNVEVIRSLWPSYDEEVVRFIKEMPQWIPGKQGGKNVSVYCSLPILFKIQDNSDTNL